MLRCLFRRLKFVKCALGEPGTSSIHLKVTTNSRDSYQCSISRNSHGMTCNVNNKAGSPESAAAVAANGKADGSLVRNGLIVDSALRSGGTFLSNGYYRTEWGQQGNQTNGEKARRGNTSKCEFDLNFINVRLLGLLGTAVAVGINVNSHINDWMPYQSRGIHDLCHYQYNRKHPSLFGPCSDPKASSSGSQCGVSPTSLSRALDCLHAKSNNEANNFSSSSSGSNGSSSSTPTTTVIQNCGSCRSCSDLLNKILKVYSNFPVSSTSTTSSIASSILNVLPQSSASAFPPVVYDNNNNNHGTVNQADGSSTEEHFFADEVDGITVGVDLTSNTGLRRLQFDSISKSSSTTITNELRAPSPVPEQKAEKKQQPQKQETRKEPTPRYTQRKKSIYEITEEESEQLKNLAAKNSISSESSESDYISLSSSNDSIVSAGEAKTSSPAVRDAAPSQSAKSPSLSTSSSSSISEDEPDIATIFRQASIEYADQLNNLVAISLMDTHHPDEAMQFWSSCEASSRAFFNMGVAYESGRYAKGAKPDLLKAHDLYALAASMGHPSAIYNLSLFYLYGKGEIACDINRGLELLETAAVKGVVAAQKFIVELRRTQFIDDLREDLQRTRSRVDILKDRPQRTSNAHFRPPLRPSPSLFGPKATPLKMKQSTEAREGAAEDSAEHSPLSKKRSNSFPDLLVLNDLPNAIAAL